MKGGGGDKQKYDTVGIVPILSRKIVKREEELDTFSTHIYDHSLGTGTSIKVTGLS